MNSAYWLSIIWLSRQLWFCTQIQRVAPKPVVLVVHGAQQGVYPENPDKGISNELFRDEVISQSNLAVVISGDLHMDMDRVNHTKKIDHVHYLHIPAVELPKFPMKQTTLRCSEY